MPRKQNGFGNPKSFAFKQYDKGFDNPKPKGAAGYYPRKRGYGTSIHRTVIESYDLNSDWVKWRKGYEYYNQAAWYRLETYDPYTQEYSETKINSVLFQGTDQEVEVVFDGYKFATKDADTNNHYVIKRTLANKDYDIGTVTSVNKDERNKKISIGVNAGPNVNALFSMINDRVTDDRTSATIKYLLTADDKPALLKGKTSPQKMATVQVEVPLDEIMACDYIKERNSNPQALVGEIVYLPDFYVEIDIAEVDTFEVEDGVEYFTIKAVEKRSNQTVAILDYNNTNLLPPSLYDIKELDKIFETTKGTSELNGVYLYQKSEYQPYYGTQYLSADLAVEDVERISYVVLPFKIQSVLVQENTLLIESIPFMSELKLYKDLTDGVIELADVSFTDKQPDDKKPGWVNLNVDVNPYMDEVFTSGGTLKPETLYSCSCPSYSKSILRAPQETQNEGTRRINRQRRYPMPTVMGLSDYNSLGLNQAAGLVESWQTMADFYKFKLCKHTIAAMFIEHLKCIEPNDYPSYESRLKFEEKLRKDIEEVASEFIASYKRGGITAIEVIFAMAQSLGLDEVETAYVVLNSQF